MYKNKNSEKEREWMDKNRNKHIFEQVSYE